MTGSDVRGQPLQGRRVVGELRGIVVPGLFAGAFGERQPLPIRPVERMHVLEGTARDGAAPRAS